MYLFCSEIFCKFACCIVLFYYCYSCCVSRNKPLSDCGSRPEDGFPLSESRIDVWGKQCCGYFRLEIWNGWNFAEYGGWIGLEKTDTSRRYCNLWLPLLRYTSFLVWAGWEQLFCSEWICGNWGTFTSRSHTYAGGHPISAETGPKSKKQTRKNMCEKAHSFLIHRRLDQFYLSMLLTWQE